MSNGARTRLKQRVVPAAILATGLLILSGSLAVLRGPSSILASDPDLRSAASLDESLDVVWRAEARFGVTTTAVSADVILAEHRNVWMTDEDHQPSFFVYEYTPAPLPATARSSVSSLKAATDDVNSRLMVCDFGWPFRWLSATWLADVGFKEPSQMLRGTYVAKAQGQAVELVIPGRLHPAAAIANLVVFFIGSVGLLELSSALRTVWRRRRGCCGRCGYTLQGISGGSCPECGFPAASPQGSLDDAT